MLFLLDESAWGQEVEDYPCSYLMGWRNWSPISIPSSINSLHIFRHLRTKLSEVFNPMRASVLQKKGKKVYHDLNLNLKIYKEIDHDLDLDKPRTWPQPRPQPQPQPKRSRHKNQTNYTLNKLWKTILTYLKEWTYITQLEISRPQYASQSIKYFEIG